jgi:hypothetical protein
LTSSSRGQRPRPSCAILEDEPDWKNVLRVVPIELDKRNVSAN